jgi:hypothetical protein
MPALSSAGKAMRGLSSPVTVPAQIDWQRDYSRTTLAELVGMTDDDLATVDPLAMNLIVAKGLPALADLDVERYQGILNAWTLDFARRCLPYWEQFFHEAPQDFRNDLRYFRLGMVCQYLEQEARIEYKRDQREVKAIHYTDPSDLFLNGVLDTREGTCGTLAALQVAIAWRMGWPVSLACVNAHFIVRYDDGETVHNIEATMTGKGAFGSDTDEEIVKKRQLPGIALTCGSDLCALRPREMLGVFIGARARHLRDVGLAQRDNAKILRSETDWLLARQLFPTNRLIYKEQMVVSSRRGYLLFDPDESGHPNTYAGCLDEISNRKRGQWHKEVHVTPLSPEQIDATFFTMEVKR